MYGVDSVSQPSKDQQRSDDPITPSHPVLYVTDGEDAVERDLGDLDGGADGPDRLPEGRREEL